MEVKQWTKIWVVAVVVIASFVISTAIGFAYTDTNNTNTSYTGIIIDNLTKSGTGTLTLTPTYSATGGTITYNGGNEIHKFTSGTSTLTPNAAFSVQYLVVAGGGGGASATHGGGGGAGGLLYNASYGVTATGYTVTVGAGGATDNNGGNSVFGAITATGGGRGTGGVGVAGGSGGGGGGINSGGAGTAGQGNAGASGFTDGASYTDGGGGGGAGAAGTAGGGSGVAGNGGAGLSSSISGSTVWYAGGGGGACNVNTTTGFGGTGGGGNNRAAGAVNTGGGGGGGGGAGGSGIVIVSFATLGVNAYTGTTALNGGAINFANGGLGASGNITFGGGALQYATGNTQDVSSRIKNSTAGAVKIDTNSNNVTFAGVINSTNTAGLTKSGAGILTLSGANTYTGTTSLNVGAVNFSNGGLGSSGNITFVGGSLQYATGNTQDISSRIKNSTTGAVSIDTNSNNVTFASSIDSSNTFGLNKNGAGTLSLAAANSYTGTTALKGGTVNFVNGGLGSSGNIFFSGGGALQYATGNTQDVSSRLKNSTASAISIDTNSNNVAFAGVIDSSNTAGLTKSGAGTLSLSATNTYTGTTAVNAGTVNFSNGGLGSSGNVTFGGGTLQYATGNTQDVSSRIKSSTAGAIKVNTNSNNVTFGSVVDSSNTAGLTKSGAGTLTISGANTYTGVTTLSNGTVSANNIVVSAGSSNLGNAASAVVLGDASNKGTLSYTGNSATFTRGFAVNAGGGQVDVTTSGQTLTMNTGTIVANGTFNVGGAGNASVASLVSGTGGINKQGAGVLYLAPIYNATGGTITYSGGNEIHTFTSGTTTFTPNSSYSVQYLVVAGGGGGASGTHGGGGGAGGLLYNASYGVTSTGYTVTVGAGGAPDNNGGNSVFGAITSTGGGAGSGGVGSAGGSGGGGGGNNNGGAGTAGQGNAGARGFTDGQSYTDGGGGGGAGAAGTAGGGSGVAGNGGAGLSYTISGSTVWYAGGGGGSCNVNTTTGFGGQGGGGNNRVSGTANTGGGGGGGGGSGGSGIVIIRFNTTGVNTYTGTTILGGGTINFTNGGMGPSGDVNFTGGALQYATGNTQDVSSRIKNSTSAINVDTNGNNVTFGSAIAATNSGGLTKAGSGILTLSGANAYTGTTTISTGTLKLGAANVITDTSAVSVAGTLDVNGFSETVGSVSGAGTITSGAAGTPTLTVGGDNASNSFSGVIQNGSATSVALTKTGTGTQTLSGANTFTGQLSVKKGALAINTINNASANGTLGNNALSVALGDTGGITGTLQYTGSTASSSKKFTMATGGSGALQVDNAGTALTLSGVIDGSGALNKTGAGTAILSGTNTFTGQLAVKNGALSIGTINNASANGTLGNSALAVSLGDTGGVTGKLQYTGATAASTKKFTMATGGAGEFQVDSAGAILTLSGVVDGSGALTKSGSGTMILSGANTYTGLTTVSAGELDLNTAGNNSIAGNLTVGGGTAKLLRADQIADAKNLAVSAGAFNVQGFNETVAGVQLTGGTISGSGGTLTSASAFDMRAGSVSAILGGTAGLTKSTSGTMTLSGINTYSGTTLVSEGTLALSGAGSIANSSIINVAGGASLDTTGFSGAFALASGQTIKGTGQVTGGLTVGSGSFLSPGNSPGIHTVNGSTEIWAGGGTYIWEIADSLGTTPGTDWDLVRLINSAQLNITATSENKFNLDVRYVGTPGTFNPLGIYSPWMIVDDAGGTISGFAPEKFNISVTGFGEGVTANQFSVASGSLMLGYSNSVPEPSSMAVSGIALGLLGWLKRMRRKKDTRPETRD